MKRCMSFILIVAFVFFSTADVFANIGPTGYYSSMERPTEWFKTMSIEARNERILTNNYAFINEKLRAWASDRVIELPSAPVMDERHNFSIPGESASLAFGMDFGTGYIDANEIAKKTGLKLFVDPRGVCLFLSDKKDVITKYNNMNESYFDYYSIANIAGYILWEDINPTEEDYGDYIRRWQASLAVPENADRTSYQVSSYIKKIVSDAYSYKDKVALGNNGEGPFSDLKMAGLDLSKSRYAAQLQSCYSRLYNMALGYSLQEEKDESLKKAVIDALEYLYEYYSPDGAPEMTLGTSWPVYAFNIPYLYGNILCILYDSFTRDDIIRHTNKIFDRFPDSTASTRTSGVLYEYYLTNRSWIGLAYLNNSILAHDTYRVNHALKYMTECFMENSASYDGLDMSPNGYYKDGSVVFHTKLGYNLGYGSTHASNVADALIVGAGTVFDIRNVPYYENIYKYIEYSYLPFIVNNNKTKIVTGRWDVTPASDNIMIHFMTVANYAPDAIRKELSRKIKAKIEGYEDKYVTVKSTVENRFVEPLIYQKELDAFNKYAKNLQAHAGESVYDHVYYNMDKYLHTCSDYTLEISMASDRMEKYEAIGTVGATDWYVNDGAAYIYTNDESQYTSSWFATVNKYCIPGTTVDSTVRPERANTNASDAPENLWAGGISDGEHGAISYILGNDKISGLDGRKSYFVLGDKIVYLGAGISGGYGDVYTVVDNRLLNKKNSDPENEAELHVKQVSTGGGFETSDENKAKVLDRNLTTGVGTDIIGAEWIFEFDKVEKVPLFALSFNQGDKRFEKFSVAFSEDGITYSEPVDMQANGKTKALQPFRINGKGKFIKIICNGNSLRDNNWFTMTEFRAYNDSTDIDELEKLLSVPDTGFEDYYIDGVKQKIEFNNPIVHNDGKILTLENFGSYAIFDDDSFTFKREVSSGSAFANVIIDHGNSPENEGYAYAVLPGKDYESTKESLKDIEIIANNDKCQAIRDKSTGKLMISAYEKCEIEGIRIVTPCELIINEEEGKIYVGDPSHESKYIDIVFPADYEIVQTNSVSKNKDRIRIDVSTDRGATFEIKFGKKSDNSSIQLKDYYINLKSGMFTVNFKNYDSKSYKYFIEREPVNGKAYIKDSILYYYSNDGGNYKDSVKISANDGSGNKAVFFVYIDKKH